VRLLDGRNIAASIRAEAMTAVVGLRRDGVEPALGVVVATDDESSHSYVRSLTRTAERAGVTMVAADLGPAATIDALAAQLRDFAAAPGVHGIILQAPLPPGTDRGALASLIPPGKDVDGASAASAGRLLTGRQGFAPATATAVLTLLDSYHIPLTGARAVVVGRSAVVGKPVAQLLLARDATVTVCHSQTRDLAAETRRAEVLVVAAGRPLLIGAGHVRPGAAVIDVGTTADGTGELVGDVNAADLEATAGALSPVPGGVGPLTTATLIANTVTAATRAAQAAATT
jgi:methylenetetrahydrofolate dehydrogenase (NADP+)/methenyltetrahydrofolate cyclohydrolase